MRNLDQQEKLKGYVLSVGWKHPNGEETKMKNYKEAFYEKAHTKPFKLSEKIKVPTDYFKMLDNQEFVPIEDIAEFIRLLKEEADEKLPYSDEFIKVIDRLAGEKFK